MKIMVITVLLTTAAWSIAEEKKPKDPPIDLSDIDFKIGGYAKLDMILDFNGARNANQFLLREIPVQGDEDYGSNGYYNMHIRETRVNLEVQKEKNKKFFTEYDFFDEANFNLRLRHAYLKYNDFYIGQYWTNISDTQSLPFMIDFAFGDTLFGGRKPQIRWEPQIDKDTLLGLSIEEPSFTSIDNPNNFQGKELPKFPIFSAKVIQSADWGHTMLGGELTQLNWDGYEGEPSDSALSWVLINSGSFSFTQTTSLKWQVSYGVSSAKGILGLAPNGSSAVLKSNGKLETDRAATFIFAIVHEWTEKVSSNFVYNGLDVDPADERDEEDIEEGLILHANVIYQLEEDIKTGVEYIWGKRTNINEKSGEDNRIQAMIRYDF